MKALLIIDMIRDFVDGKFGNERVKSIVPRIKELILYFRKKGYPVIYLKDSHIRGDREFSLWGEHGLKGDEGSEIVRELEPQENDYVIEKRRYSGFFGTSLDLLLRELEVKEVVLTGTSTDICVFHTAADAFYLTYRITVISDATASISTEEHEGALERMKKFYGAKVMSTEEFINE